MYPFAFLFIFFTGEKGSLFVHFPACCVTATQSAKLSNRDILNLAFWITQGEAQIIFTKAEWKNIAYAVNSSTVLKLSPELSDKRNTDKQLEW